MDWRFFNGPMITTQTQTLVPLRVMPVPPPPRLTPGRATLRSVGMSGFWDQAFGWAFVDKEDEANIKAADKKLAEINDAALARGAVTQEMHDITEKHIEDTNYEAILNDPEMSVFRGFVEGAQEGLLADVAALKSVTGSIFGSIPIQVYAVVGVALLALYFIKKK